MTAKDVFAGKLKIGDTVRFTHNGAWGRVMDLVQTSIDGTKVAVLLHDGQFTDISNVEKIYG